MPWVLILVTTTETGTKNTFWSEAGICNQKVDPWKTLSNDSECVHICSLCCARKSRLCSTVGYLDLGIFSTIKAWHLYGVLGALSLSLSRSLDIERDI